MKKIVFSLLLTCFIIAAQAQAWQWGRRGGGSSGSNNQAEKIVDMQTDKNGNVYMLAQLDGGGDATVGTQGADSALLYWGSRDAALISYDCSGKFRWAKVFGSDIDDQAIGMTMDTLGHIYVAVQTDKNFNVDIDSFVANPKRKVIGLAQYDTAGHFKWFKQPSPDTVNSTKNLSQYFVFNTATTLNGDTYLFCYLGTGLISGSTNLVVTTSGWYMLKYNVAGVPKELIKLDMNIPVNTTTSSALDGDYLNATNFSVTKSGKLVFTGIRVKRNNGAFPITVAGQALKHPVNLICFSHTGSVLWRVENKDTTTGGLSGRPVVDESKGLIYVCGGGLVGIGDTLGGVAIINQGNHGNLPFWACLDTLSNFKQVRWGSCYKINGNALSSLTFRSDSRLFAYGYGAGVIWDSYKFDGGNFIGYQTFMPSFDANTGNIMSMDSLRGSSVTYGDVITADNNNNIYVGGQFSSDISVAGQVLQTAGGQSDFFVAKYGFNCGTVPLKYIFFTATPKKEENVKLDWATANEINVSRFNVQRSINGKDFTTIHKEQAKNQALNNYSFIDETPNEGVNYYRILSVDKDGKISFSEVRELIVNHSSLNTLAVYPNPAHDVVNIECKEGIKEVKIINSISQQIAHFVRNDGTHQHYQFLIANYQLPKGLYVVQVITSKGEIKNAKLMVE